MSILCLDLGTKTGWASHRDGRIYSGWVDFTPSRFASSGSRYRRFREWLTEQKACFGGFSFIWYEGVSFNRNQDGQVYGAFMGVLQEWCTHHEIEYDALQVGTIKKHIAGKGNADKDAVKAAVCALGHHPKTYDEADAIALLYCIASRHGLSLQGVAA